MTANRFGLTAALAGIAALGGAGTLAAVLPAPGSSVARPVALADTATGRPDATSTGTGAARSRRTAATPGAGPFPHTAEPISSGIFDL